MIAVRTTLLRHLALVSIAMLAIACFAACGDEDQDAGLETEFQVDVLEVIVHDDRIEPATVTLRVPDQVTLDLTNRSSTACSFNLGGYVRDFEVGPGDQDSIAFTVIDVDSDISPNTTTMGCAGDGPRNGTLEVLDSSG
ncbi:MAG: hypothetical protein AB7I38_02865 [Dehalococcoidia bacterium]